jgi:hypothetical protein
MNTNIWKKIQYWKRKYNKTPNGWAVAHIIGEEYGRDSKKNKTPK